MSWRQPITTSHFLGSDRLYWAKRLDVVGKRLGCSLGLELLGLETVLRRVLERLCLVSWHWRLGLETHMSRDLASPKTSSTSSETFQPNTNYVKLKLQTESKKWKSWKCTFYITQNDKITFSNFASYQHPTWITSTTAAPVVCTGKLSAASEKLFSRARAWFWSQLEIGNPYTDCLTYSFLEVKLTKLKHKQ